MGSQGADTTNFVQTVSTLRFSANAPLARGKKKPPE